MVPYCLNVVKNIVNISIEEGVFPQIRTSANGVPLPKMASPSSYYDLSILYKHVIEFMNTNVILPPIQFGFRSGHIITIALLEVAIIVLLQLSIVQNVLYSHCWINLNFFIWSTLNCYLQNWVISVSAKPQWDIFRVILMAENSE